MTKATETTTAVVPKSGSTTINTAADPVISAKGNSPEKKLFSWSRREASQVAP